ncbi:MAG TPA: hypothetical protein VFF48_12165 [Brevundimonas sp.]|nr:hypothetical protein [Brevundimonas sp.]
MSAQTEAAMVTAEDMREKARRWQSRAAAAVDPRQRRMFEQLAADYEAAAIPARRHGA